MQRFYLVATSRRALVLISLLAAVLLAGGAYLYVYGRTGKAFIPAVLADAQPADAEAGSAGSPTDILLGLARNAIREDRLVAPAGANAYEFYLSVLQLEPENQAAQDALRETFPFASAMVERAINQKQLDEAQREIALLREFDETNYTLVILGAKLDAQRQMITREDERIAASMQSSDRRRSVPSQAPEPVAPASAPQGRATPL
jgi:protein TonB